MRPSRKARTVGLGITLIFAAAAARAEHPPTIDPRALALSMADSLGSTAELPASPPSPKGLALIPPGAHEEWSYGAQLARLGATRRAPEEAFTFGLIGDVEPGRTPFQRMFPPHGRAFEEQMRSMQGRGVDFVLQLGDIVSVGNGRNYARFLRSLAAVAERPFFPVIGNHDRAKTRPQKPADKSLHRAIFGPADLAFERGGCRFVLLDNSDNGLSPEQLSWLDAQLDTPLCKIVAMHIPPIYLKTLLVGPGRTPVDEPAEVRTKPSFHYFNAGAAEFADIVSRRRVDRVYMGHIHALAYADYRGVRYVVSGGGGSPIYRLPWLEGEKIAHYMLVEVGPDGVRERIVPLKGGERRFAKQR